MATAERAKNASAGAKDAATRDATHAEVHTQLTDLLEGSLQDPQLARLKRHVAQCAACRNELASMACTVRLLGTLPPRSAPSGVRQRLLAIPDTERSEGTSAGAVHRSLAALTCPPHYWHIEPRSHGWEHWTCHRCGAECDRPRGRPRRTAEPGATAHAP
jgi:anti-sigma factor RsiW